MAYLLQEVPNVTAWTSTANQRETAKKNHTDSSSFCTQISSSKIFADSIKI